jgi:hypothetical protein
MYAAGSSWTVEEIEQLLPTTVGGERRLMFDIIEPDERGGRPGRPGRRLTLGSA